MKLSLATLPAATRRAIKASPRYRALFARLPDTLLGVDNNAKTVKGAPMGYRTAILYLAPASSSGINVCPMAQVAQCAEACLNSAGRGAMVGVQMARLRKTLYWQQYPAAFVAQLALEIGKLRIKAQRDGVTLLVRLNGTSDIEWERVAPSLFSAFPDVQFYDYTKIPNRRDLPANYDLTFSYSGVPAYQKHFQKARLAGYRVAVVFRTAESIPATFAGMPCIGGDDSDVRHVDPHGVVVALYAKGQAKTDRSGFVVDGSGKNSFRKGA